MAYAPPETPPPSWATWQKIINGRDVPDRSTVVEAPTPNRPTPLEGFPGFLPGDDAP